MSYTVTVDNFPEFIAKFATQVATHKSLTVDVYDNSQFYQNSDEYLLGRTNEIVGMSDFINDLKDRYAYPQA